MTKFLNCKSILVLILIVQFSLLSAQDNLYDVSKIPTELLENANAVMRSYSAAFEIDDIDNASLKVHYAITILNKSALRHSYFVKFYNKFIKIRSIEANVYDENGDPIKNNKIKNDEIHDYSAIGGGTLYDDSRVKAIDPEIKKYPFTVEYSYQINFKGILSYPNWQLFEDYNMAVEKSKFEVIVPANMEFRYLEKNEVPKLKISSNAVQDIYTWDTSNVCPLVDEYFSQSLIEKSPVVYLAPNDFSIGGYEGNCESWENFGKWILLINQDKDILPEDVQQEIKDLVKGVTDELEKSKLLYEYMQNKTRYVSVQIGVGGWQTIDAETVSRLCYGDCKALSNYMKSILEVVGIKSYYTLVSAGHPGEKLLTEFPSNQFNHVILCLPISNDTIWLECTNQNIPFGYIGSFTQDRNVLLIADDGSHLVRTKRYGKNENQQIRNATVNVHSRGQCDATIETQYKGILYDDMVQTLLSDAADQKKLMYDKIDIPNFEIVNFNHAEQKQIIPCVKEDIKLILDNYGVVFGNRMMINLNLMNKIKVFPDQDVNRTSDIILERSFVEIDTITFNLPVGYTIEDVPFGKAIESQYGEYSFSIDYGASSLKYVRYLSVNKGVYPKENYPEFLDFYNEIVAADKSKFVLTIQ